MINQRAMLDELARNAFGAFARLAFFTLRPHEKYLHNWHIDAICHELEQTYLGHSRRLIVTIPPRHLKSLLISVIFPAWLMVRNPGAKILCLSYSRDLATAHARDFQRLVGSSLFKRLAPNVNFNKITEDVSETSSAGARYARSIDGSVTGFGGQFVIIDDPLKSENAASKAERDKVNQAYSRTVLSRPDNKANAVVIIVMQRLHEEYLVGFVTSNAAIPWRHLNLPAIAQAKQVIELGNGRTHTQQIGDLLHPEREPVEVLEELRSAMLSDDFSAQYLQAPVPAGGAMIRREWLRYYNVAPDREGGSIIQSLDTALVASSDANYSVCTTWLLRGEDHYLLDVYRARLEFPDLLRAVKNQYEFHRPQKLLIEAKGSGISLIQTMKSLHQVWVVEIKVKDDKVTRLNRVLHLFEQGRVFLPTSAPWLEELKQEWLSFPNGKYDDQVDSTSQYLCWFADGGGRNTFEFDF